jgi:biotin carboxyl carrier protein
MKYFVTINDRVTEVEIDGERVTVDGQEVRATLTRVPGSPEVRLLLDGESSVTAVDQFQGGTWRLVDQGLVIDVEALDERTRHIRTLGGAARAASGGGVLKAPMPGLVVRIGVAEGDQVTQGQGLVVLEAMKMENELKAPAAGTVGAIRVAVGQAVEKGAVLLELRD